MNVRCEKGSATFWVFKNWNLIENLGKMPACVLWAKHSIESVGMSEEECVCLGGLLKNFSGFIVTID